MSSAWTSKVYTVFALVMAWAASAAVARDVPDFGVILNDDGDYSFIGPTPEDSASAVRVSVDALVGTPVRTLVYCVGAGSDTLYYPTEVASEIGWRETEYDRERSNPDTKQRNWRNRILKIREGIATGVDPIRIAGERAKTYGMYFFPSIRMNDNHFMSDPQNYPLTGKFWIDNQDLIIAKSGESPILGSEDYANLLDFSHEKVRAYRLAIIREVLDRYGDISDGIELDFNRTQVYFPRGAAEDRAHLITQLVADVRRMLDERSERDGRAYYLIARIPPTPKNCRWAGLDIDAWMRDRLVDVISPAQLMTLAHDMPIDAFVAMADPAGCKVYPSLYPRTNFGWDFTADPTEADYAREAARAVTPELMRGAASNYWRMGATGFYLFNFHHEERGVRPYSDASYRILRDLASPAVLDEVDIVYAVTPGYYLDHEDTYQNRKQLPAPITLGERPAFHVELGDEVRNDRRENAKYVGLRLGFRDLPEGVAVRAWLNGVEVHTFGGAAAIVKTTGKAPKTAATCYWQAPLPDDMVMHPGRNTIELQLTSGTDGTTPGGAPQLVEARIALLYDRPFIDLLFTPPSGPVNGSD